jgi:hypothetical protein
MCKIIKNCSLLFVVLFVFSCKKENSNTNYVCKNHKELKSKKYDEVCFMMTHNAMNNTEKGYSVPNQTQSITNQLNNCVRGLMIDTYDGTDGNALTYHGVPLFGQQKLVDVLKEVKDFLVANRDEVVTIIFQNEGSNVQLEKAIDSIDLDDLCYINTTGTWPTIQTLIDANKRLVCFVERNNTPRAAYLMYAWSTIFDTKYTYEKVSDFDSDVNRGGSGSKQLYLVNHWLQSSLGLPDKNLAPSANTCAVLGKRVQDCSNANSHFINFIGVDFYEIGDARAIVDSINGF